MDKEWLYIGIFFLVLVLILILCIVKIAPWFKKLKSGEIDLSRLPSRYYEDHPEEFSIEHTYSIMKSPMGQNILKKDRQRLLAFFCLWGLSMLAIYFSPQWSNWLAKLMPFVATPPFIFISAVVFMGGAAAAVMKLRADEKIKIWVCPYCKKPLMRIQLPSKESKEYWDNPKAIFMSHRWGRRNLLLVSDRCPYCKKKTSLTVIILPCRMKKRLLTSRCMTGENKGVKAETASLF